MNSTKIRIGAAAGLAFLALTVLPTAAETVYTLPICPDVTYDGVLPEDGGQGPIWEGGVAPDYDCDGPGHVDLGDVDIIDPATTIDTTPQPAPTAVPAVVASPEFTG